jgi:hypothetical protein
MAGQQYSTSSLGGYLSQPYLTQRLRAQAQPQFRFRQFVDVKESIGKNRGDTWLFDKRGNVATQGTVLAETNTMPQTNFTVGLDKGEEIWYNSYIPELLLLAVLG